MSSASESLHVSIYDTTLRDGTQREGLTLSLHDKLRIAEHLDAFGVDFIEGGWPGSNPKDVEFFERARDREWKHSIIAAFGSTRRANIAAEGDGQLQALVAAGTKACTIFGKTWNLHVTEVLRTTLDENLRMIEDSIRFLVANDRRAIYDAEHFFDGYRADPSYALETLAAAARGGAEAIALCDTNGGSLPWDVEAVVREVVARFPQPIIGMHVHDDTGCAVANSLAGVRAGARHIQGTINGYGERCGNANLSTIIPNIELKFGLHCVPDGQLARISDLSRYVAEIANEPMNEHTAYVGRSAFAHKGGVHVAAMQRAPESYQHVEPERVGNVSRVVISELSGRGNVVAKAQQLGIEVAAAEGAQILERIKSAEARGFAYEAAEASVALLIARQRPEYSAPFTVVDFQATVGRRADQPIFVEATVKVRVGDAMLHTAGDGNGPVSALDVAIRKAIGPSFAQLAELHLSDYKVRILDGQNGTSSTTRVLIDWQFGDETFSTVGASSNVIEASLQALVDGLEYGLSRGR